MFPILSPEEQRLFAELAQHPAWGVLREVVKKQMETKFAFHASQLMGGTEVDQRTVDFDRGYFAGMKHLLDSPGRELNKILKEQREEVTGIA